MSIVEEVTAAADATDMDSANGGDHSLVTQLLVASQNGDTEAVTKLLSEGAKVDAVAVCGQFNCLRAS